VTECCKVMALVIGRAKSGITKEPSWNYKTGETDEVFVVRFAKSRDKGAEHPDATYAVLSWCPFCKANLAPNAPEPRATPKPRRARKGRKSR
jgi:hypothetical protein